jgi:hypothetical protein
MGGLDLRDGWYVQVVDVQRSVDRPVFCKREGGQGTSMPLGGAQGCLRPPDSH